MTEEAMAILITHADGIFKGAPDSSRIVVFLNKVDILNGLEKAERIAQKFSIRDIAGSKGLSWGS